MKEILRATLSVTPILVVTIVVAYIIEELLEDFVNETVSDLVYPITALIVFGVFWYRVVPVIKSTFLHTPDGEKISE